MYDVIIAGAGFFGSTFARMATDAGKKCLVIEKKDHIAGMAYDKDIEGIKVSKYGGHIFHTNNDDVWSFVNRFSKFNSFINRPKVYYKGKIHSFPINMLTFHELWGVNTPTEALQKLNEVRIPCENPRNFEEWILSMVGREIYETFFYSYTKKQWHKEPSELPASIIKRLPIRLTYDDNYFSTVYQGMPVEGYTNLIKNMLDGIDVELGCEVGSDWQKYGKVLVYTGEVDKFFNYEYGKLSYNTLRFETKRFIGDYQGNAVINYTDNTPYIRSVEHKHFYNKSLKHYKEDKDVSMVTFDYPAEVGEPFYPIRDEINSKIYEKYNKIKPSNIVFGGRLGNFVYCDMDVSISSAMQKCGMILK